jgi:S1-C subfamily serine protease
VEVVQVIDDGPAERAGLRRGDVLVELDGEPVQDAGDLQRLMVHERIGRSVIAVVLRSGQELDVPVLLDELS